MIIINKRFKKIIALSVLFLLCYYSIPTMSVSAYEVSQSEQDSLFKQYGFTGRLVSWNSCDRDYEWYEDQGSTGRYGYENCAPSVASMAIKWSNEAYTGTGEDARNLYLPYGGWWYTTTITQYLDDNNISNRIAQYEYNKCQIKELINCGFIGILCINTSYLTFESNSNSVIGRYYGESAGHAIIVKGYVHTTENFYVEVYDPYSMGAKYSDDTYKGKNRYYTLEDLNNAVRNCWENMIIINGSE